MIVATDDMRDFHQCVVDDYHVVVNRHSAGTQDDGIADDLVRELNVTVNDVVEADWVLGNLEANGGELSGVAATLGLGWIELPACALVNRLTPFGNGALAFFL